MAVWGVDMAYSGCQPGSPTPIIVQDVAGSRPGAPRRRWRWRCPTWGTRLPHFRPITLQGATGAAAAVPEGGVLFLDRVSPGALQLADLAADRGSLIFFEPSQVGNPTLFRAALGLAHVVKYAHDRLQGVDAFMPAQPALLPPLQFQEFGFKAVQLAPSDRVDTLYCGPTCS